MLALAGCGAGPSGNNTTETTAADAGNATVGAGETVATGNGTAENGTSGAGTGENATANASGNGTLDVDALQSQHVQSVREAGSLTVVVNGTTESDRIRTTTNSTAQIDLTNNTSYQQSVSDRTLVAQDNGSNASNDSAGSGQSMTQTVALYTANGTTYVQATSGDGEPRYQVLNGSEGGAAFAASNEQYVTLQGLFQVIDATSWTQSSNGTGNGTTYTASGAESLDTDALFGSNASGMAGNVSGGANASDDASANGSGTPSFDVNVTAYDATLVVSENGTLDEYSYTMTVDMGGRETTISRTYDVQNVGNTTVEAPDWLDDAREQSGSLGSGTTGGAENGTTGGAANETTTTTASA